jgi:hypothetical protein
MSTSGHSDRNVPFASSETLSGSGPKWLFEPWIGERYRQSDFCLRTLVIGDSTYRSKGYDEEYRRYKEKWFNERVIRPYANGEWQDRFFTSWINALAGRRIEKSERKGILDQVAFYNYFDQVLEGKRMPPDVGSATSQSAREKYLWMLQQYEPELCILVSFRAGDALFQTGPHRDFRSSILSGGFAFESGRGRRTQLLCLPHPSCPSLWKIGTIWPAVGLAAETASGMRRGPERRGTRQP